jgi:predicted kinase
MTNQQELLLTRGIPGSGKSTYAYKWLAEDPENRVRVNRDDLRMELYGKYVILDDKGGMDKNAEGRVTQEEQKRIRAALKAGKSVIVDNTNINMRVIPGYQKLAQENGANLSHKDFPISLEEAQRRNAARDRVVDPTVIERMYKNNLGPNGEFHLFPGDFKTRGFRTPFRREAGAIFDLDGTLVDVRDVRHFVKGKFRNFDMFHRSSLWSPPNPEVVELLKDTQKAGMPIIIVSARQEIYRDISQKWLADNGIEYDNMYLRPQEDARPDFYVKHDILKKVREHYDVAFAVDDNPAVRDVWLSNKIRTIIVPGFEDGEVEDGETIHIDNVIRRGGCVRCGRKLKGGGIIGPECAKFV